MKVRRGFVSNSSTASFLIDLNKFENIFDLTERILTILIEDLRDALFLNERDRKEYSLYRDRLRSAKTKKLDKDTPVMFPTINFDTFIMKKDDGYYVDTDLAPEWDLILDLKDYMFDDSYDLDSEDVAYYILEYDVIGKMHDESRSQCLTKNTHPYLYQAVELDDGKIVCLECEFRKGTLGSYTVSDIKDNSAPSITSYELSIAKEERESFLADLKNDLTWKKRRTMLKEEDWMKLYTIGLTIFEEETEQPNPDFTLVMDASNFMMEIGVEQNDQKIIYLAKLLMARSLSFSEDKNDLEYALSIFEESKPFSETKANFYPSEYHKKVVNKLLKRMKKRD